VGDEIIQLNLLILENTVLSHQSRGGGGLQRTYAVCLAPHWLEEKKEKRGKMRLQRTYAVCL